MVEVHEGVPPEVMASAKIIKLFRGDDQFAESLLAMRAAIHSTVLGDDRLQVAITE